MASISIFVCTGIDLEGYRHILGYRVMKGKENIGFWTEVLQDLISRGLSKVAIFVTDHFNGLEKLIPKLFPLSDPWETVQPKTVSIRIRNINQTTEKTIKKEDIPEKKRYTIGNQEILSNQAIIDKGSVQIVYPLDGDRFVINRHNQEQNWIKLQAVSEESLPYIDWFINGEFYIRTGPPYETYWSPEQGIYRITAITPLNRADSIRIVVE